MSETQNYKTASLDRSVIVLGDRAADYVSAACTKRIVELTSSIDSNISKEFPLSTHILEKERAELLDVVACIAGASKA